MTGVGKGWLWACGIGLVLLGAALVGLRWKDGEADAGVRAGAAGASGPSIRALPRLPAPKLPARATKREQGPEPAPVNSLGGLFRNGIPSLTRAQLDTYLESRQRDADSLIIASRLADDLSLVREAAASFAGDPRVQFELGLRGESPEERRKALQACRELDPDNPLPDYLLALDSLDDGRSDDAVECLTRACDKRGLTDYMAECSAGARDAYRSAGFSPLQAEAAGMFGGSVPHLGSLGKLAKKIGELQQGYRQQGDAESAEALGQIGVEMAVRLAAQPGRYLITDLVALGIEQRMLESLPADAALAAGGGTAGERLAALAERRELLRGLGLTSERVLTLPEQEALGYFERVRRDGEAAALLWLQQGQGDAEQP